MGRKPKRKELAVLISRSCRLAGNTIYRSASRNAKKEEADERNNRTLLGEYF